MLQYGQRKMKGENLETTANGGNKMYYSSGNYEAFARPKKPAGVDRKSAYLEGTELDGTVQNRLAALRRDIASVTL